MTVSFKDIFVHYYSGRSAFCVKDVPVLDHVTILGRQVLCALSYFAKTCSS